MTNWYIKLSQSYFNIGHGKYDNQGAHMPSVVLWGWSEERGMSTLRFNPKIHTEEGFTHHKILPGGPFNAAGRCELDTKRCSIMCNTKDPEITQEVTQKLKDTFGDDINFAWF